CDEIAYNAHDMDDGLAAGMITLADLESVALWRRVRSGRELAGVEHARYQGVRALINAQVTDLVETTAERLRSWNLQSPDEVRAAPGPAASLSEGMAALNGELRAFLFDRVYRHYRIQRLGIKARRIVTELFQSLTSDPGQLPGGLVVLAAGSPAGAVPDPHTL